MFDVVSHPSAGYQTYFEKLAIAVFLSEFKLSHVKPADPRAQVITPFGVYTSLPVTEKVEVLVVHDANGKREMPAEQIPDVK